jgi:hypothetical protein
MRTPNDPADVPLTIPPKAAPAPAPAPAAPNPVKNFEIGNWGATLPDGLKPAKSESPEKRAATTAASAPTDWRKLTGAAVPMHPRWPA